MSTKIKLNGDWVDVANNSVSDSVRNPDWSRAVGISDAQILAGWTAPEDGIIVMPYVIPNGGASIQASVSINGIDIIKPYYGATSSDQRPLSMQCPIAAGDILKSNVSVTVTGQLSKFVPYRVQKSQEESHAIIQIVRDASEGTTLPKSSTTTPLQLAHWTLPKKGIYLIQAVVTLALDQNTGVSVIHPQYSINSENNSTININMTINATTDNYVVPIRARCYTDINAVIGGFNISGQAIKLY